ncbi:MAG: cupin domain-containing protein [Candidatus Methylacidiphilales bacterium]
MKSTEPPLLPITILPSARAETLAQDWGGLTWFASQSLGNSAEVTVGRCVLLPGQSNPRHYHPNCSEVLVVIQGRIRHTDGDGGTTEMGEGDTVTIAPHVWHQATNIGAQDAVLFIVFTSASRETVGE